MSDPASGRVPSELSLFSSTGVQFQAEISSKNEQWTGCCCRLFMVCSRFYVWSSSKWDILSAIRTHKDNIFIFLLHLSSQRKNAGHVIWINLGFGCDQMWNQIPDLQRLVPFACITVAGFGLRSSSLQHLYYLKVWIFNEDISVVRCCERATLVWPWDRCERSPLHGVCEGKKRVLFRV